MIENFHIPESNSKKSHFYKSNLQQHYHFSETAVASVHNKPEARRRKSCLSQDSISEKQLTKITEEDLTTEGEPSDGYWKTLAEKRRIALDISLKENEELHEKIGQLEEELNSTRDLLESAHEMVDILKEIIQEKEDGENNTDSDGQSSSNQNPECSQNTHQDIDDDDDDDNLVAASNADKSDQISQES